MRIQGSGSGTDVADACGRLRELGRFLTERSGGCPGTRLRCWYHAGRLRCRCPQIRGLSCRRLPFLVTIFPDGSFPLIPEGSASGSPAFPSRAPSEIPAVSKKNLSHAVRKWTQDVGCHRPLLAGQDFRSFRQEREGQRRSEGVADFLNCHRSCSQDFQFF